jgi:hypothetical protein
MNFQEWLEENPLAWHPGLQHKEEEHHLYLQTRLISLGFLQKYEYDWAPKAIASLEAALPSGFQGPYDPKAHVRVMHAYEDVRIKWASDEIERIAQEIDPEVAAAILARKAAQFRRIAVSARERRRTTAQA